MLENSQPTQTLVHLPRQQQRSPETELPRGECRYILPVDVDGSRQRCTCVSFSLNKSVPGSQCGCSHQAWHHVAEPVGGYVSIDEHHAVLEKVRRLEEQTRRLQEDAARDRKEKEKVIKDVQQGYYSNMYHMRYYIDEKMEKLRLHIEDKLEGVEDKVAEIPELKQHFFELDENLMRIEEKSDSPPRQSRSLTPFLEGQASPSHPPHPERLAPELPFRTEKRYPDAWDCRVILLPSQFLHNAFSFDSVPFRRCQTRGLHQDLRVRDRTSHAFNQGVEANFLAILRRRPWMPLQCLNSSDMSLGRLRTEAIQPQLWNYTFLESQCMAHDKLQGDVIYIALQHEDLTWEDIRSLPRVFGSDESCWQHDNEWDGQSKADIAAEDEMDTDRPRPDTESLYSSPPPYTSRASMYAPDTPRQGPIRNNPLDVLAAASLARPQGSSLSERSHYSSGVPSISERSNYSAPSIISEHSVSSMASIESTLALSEADEHRNKRPKRGFLLRSPSHPTLPAPGGSIRSAPNSPPQGQMYYSGRSKRKIPANKHKDPLDWRPSEISFKNLLHRHDSKEKRPQTSSGSHAQQQQQSHEEHPTS